MKTRIFTLHTLNIVLVMTWWRKDQGNSRNGIVTARLGITAPKWSIRVFILIISGTQVRLAYNVATPLYVIISNHLNYGLSETQYAMTINPLTQSLLFNTVETLYNTVNFCWSTHKRHSIARPKGRGMGCLLWVQRATYSVDLSKLSSIKYLL